MDNFLIAKATDVGVTRQVNEDSMTVFDSPNGQVMAVCDGMGGQAAGDVASQLAVNIIENILTDNTFETPEEAIRRSILAANQGVLNRTAQNPELEGMGSTCVMLIIKDGRVHCGWVGDSRIYYIANHTIRQISHDQSYVQQLLDSGQITPDEAVNHPQKNEITNCIGLQGMTPPNTVAVPIVPEPGSIFLLCSDGLSSMVDEKQIERVLSNQSFTLQEKADRLVAMANEAGGLDNITVELVQFGTSDVAGATSGTLFEAPKGINRGKIQSRKLLYSIIGIFVITALCLAGGYIYTQNQKEKDKTEKTKPDGQKGSFGTTNNTHGTPTSTSTPTPPTSPTTPTQKSQTTDPSTKQIIKQTGNKNTKKVQEVTNGNKEEEKKNEDENVLEKIEHIEGSPEKEGDNYTIVMQTAKGTSK